MTNRKLRREVRWTENAIDDLKFRLITKSEWKVIRTEVERIADLENIDLDASVCRIRQCDGLWSRLKISRPSQIRVIFVEEAGDPPRIVIQGVYRRTGRCYDMVEIFFHLWQQEEELSPLPTHSPSPAPSESLKRV